MNAFFLFAGTRLRRKRLGDTVFRCPGCGTFGPAERSLEASWAHLYWIPLFRTGTGREVIVCRTCGGVSDGAPLR